MKPMATIFLLILASLAQAQPFTHSNIMPGVCGFALSVTGTPGTRLALVADATAGTTITLTAQPAILTVGGLPVTETTATLSVRYRSAAESGVKVLGQFVTRDIGEVLLTGYTPAQIKGFWRAVAAAVASNIADPAKRKATMQDIKGNLRQWRIDIFTSNAADIAARRAREDLEAAINTGVVQ